MAFTLGESAPHPAFGHPLPASTRGARGSMGLALARNTNEDPSPRVERGEGGRRPGEGRSRLKFTPLGLCPGNARASLTNARSGPDSAEPSWPFVIDVKHECIGIREPRPHIEADRCIDGSQNQRQQVPVRHQNASLTRRQCRAKGRGAASLCGSRRFPVLQTIVEIIERPAKMLAPIRKISSAEDPLDQSIICFQAQVRAAAERSY
jgi:hypothetical protein